MTGNETPFIVGTTRDLTCTADDINVVTIEWKLVFAGFEPTLLSANNVNELTIQPTPFQIGQQMYKCVVTDISGFRYSEDAMVTVQGMHNSIARSMPALAVNSYSKAYGLHNA